MRAPLAAACAALVAGLTLLGGCHRILPFNTVETDAAVSDVAVADGPADAPPAEGMPGPDLDAAISPPPKDALPVDLPVPQEAAVVVGACAAGASVVHAWSSTMVICRSDSGVKNNQCGAKTLCAGGWHICTAGEYQTGGGAVGAPLGVFAWIAGCSLRTGMSYPAPTDGVCPCAGGLASAEQPAAIECQGTAKVTSKAEELGQHVFSQCYRIGDLVAGPEAYWLPASSTGGNYDATVCCKN